MVLHWFGEYVASIFFELGVFSLVFRIRLNHRYKTFNSYAGYGLRRAYAVKHCKSYILPRVKWLISMAGRLPAIVTSVCMGNFFFSAELSDRE